MSTVNQVKVGSTTYDISPAPSGTLVAVGSTSWTSGDAASPTAWTSVNAITTSDANNTIFNKITSMVKNVRYLYTKLGTTDFSAVGSTTSAALVALNNGKSATTHNHDSAYAAKSHSHSNYSLTTHTHSNYSTTGHTHSNYASSTHNHDSAYAAKSHSHSEYSLTSHTHSNYSTTGHTHSNYSTTGHTHSYIATSSIVTTQTNSTTKVPAASLVKSMNDTLTSLNNASKILIVERAGTGTVGTSSAPITITFSKAVKYVYIMGEIQIYDTNRWYVFPYFYGASNTASYGFAKMSDITTSFTNLGIFVDSYDSSGQQVKRSSDNKTIYWYNTRTSYATDVFNGSGYTYIFMGLY